MATMTFGSICLDIFINADWVADNFATASCVAMPFNLQWCNIADKLKDSENDQKSSFIMR